jgi:hypothetical protein
MLYLQVERFLPVSRFPVFLSRPSFLFLSFRTSPPGADLMNLLWPEFTDKTYSRYNREIWLFGSIKPESA